MLFAAQKVINLIFDKIIFNLKITDDSKFIYISKEKTFQEAKNFITHADIIPQLFKSYYFKSLLNQPSKCP